MPQRLYTIFEESDESTLLAHCEDDFIATGFTAFESRNMAARVLKNARNRIAMGSAWAPAATSGSGVTPEDVRWYWGLPPIARAVMEQFDAEVQSTMWMECHRVNLCIEDLEADLRKRLPTFGVGSTSQTEDAPLPWELRRRFVVFITKIRQDDAAFRAWTHRCQSATSMNAAVREEIRAGRL